ncbi:hypothetical protein HAHE_12400 [Haloferula helveola]|uniref:Glutamine amidotransferase domain-containing protein n=1 Tax=Haloferula helveola TaxID=490095 RepID=A0ABN6H406_9BACT|nr:hypothetical protein HAHE_12400 [Haloferula helveola]
MTWDPVIPLHWIALAALLALGSSLWAAVRANKRLGKGRATMLTVVRILAIAGILALLLQPSKREVHHPPVRQRSILVAIDTSASMQTADLDGATRFDIARKTVLEDLLPSAGDTPVDLFLFDHTARPVSPAGLEGIPEADGDETKIHSSVERIVASTHNPPPAGLFLFTDGHDFEGEPPSRTARAARAREIPIFTVPTGTPATAPDVSLRIASYHPYTFIGQSTRLSASIRTSGFPNQQIVVDLLRDGKPADSKTLETGAATFLDVDFSVTEEEAGQYEYTMRARPMPGETETANNSTSTFLNVVDDKLRILEIEGRPYWDSTFLRRSITRNDKFEIDSLVAFAEGRVRAIRSDPELVAEALSPPAKMEDFNNYHLVVLGKEAERVLGETGIRALEQWVKEGEGIVIFARGRAWTPEIGRDLEPITWGDKARTGVALDLSAVNNFPPLRILQEARREDAQLSFDALPGASEPKTLATVFGRTLEDQPAIVYRRYGKGQALSLGIANAWRWVFNERAEFDNNAFDRFWDQTALWLLANRGLTPLSGFSFTANSANIPIGETISFSLSAAGVELPPEAPAITVFFDGRPLTKLSMSKGEGLSGYSATFNPENPGRYEAAMTMPDGERKTVRFISYRQNLERVETAVDMSYLRALSRASGGTRIEPKDLTETVKQLLIETGRQDPIERIRPIWPTAPFFLLLILLLSMDWYLRRKWGLA